MTGQTPVGDAGLVPPLDVGIRTHVGEFHLDVAFRAAGGITALFGPSGAGKTLTLRSIAGLEAPTEGRVVVKGRVLLDRKAGIDLPTRERRVGYLFQNPTLFPHLDVEANVLFGLRGVLSSFASRPSGPQERSVPRERAAQLLELVGLPGFGERRTSRLSGGERQRVALARALAPEPDLLLLDEPFAALDDELRERLQGELLALQRRTGVAMLVVTHDPDEVRRLAHHVVRMRGGKVVGAGTAAELLG